MGNEKKQGVNCEEKLVAIYVRLSVNENGERDESLQTQCELLKNYVEKNQLGFFKLYIDSDVSGTSFERPGLNRLMADIDEGIVSVMVVKDLSRIGRNNGESLLFLDHLNEKNVRVISLGDNYDSFQDDGEIIGIKTWVNEHYARDISKKVRYNLKKKMQNGEYLGRPPFGYLKTGELKNKLVVDERYRHVIKKIFDLYIQGWGYRALAGYVQSLGIPTPSVDKGYAHTPKSVQWSEQHIQRIISNRVYCGDSIQGIREKVSFKSKKTRRLDQQKWIEVTGTHEPIISREIYQLAQQVKEKRGREGAVKKPGDNQLPHLFTGFLVCGRCGAGHVYKKQPGRHAAYICSNYNRLGLRGCTAHRVNEEDLIKVIIEDVKKMGEGVSFYDNLVEKYDKELVSSEGVKDNIKKLEWEIRERKRQEQEVYLDKLKGIISQDMFREVSSRLEKEINSISGQLQELKMNLDDKGNGKNKINDLNMEQVNKDDIDRLFLENFLEKIIVTEDYEKLCDKVREKYDIDSVINFEEKENVRLIILYKVTW